MGEECERTPRLQKAVSSKAANLHGQVEELRDYRFHTVLDKGTRFQTVFMKIISGGANTLVNLEREAALGTAMLMRGKNRQIKRNQTSD